MRRKTPENLDAAQASKRSLGWRSSRPLTAQHRAISLVLHSIWLQPCCTVNVGGGWMARYSVHRGLTALDNTTE